MAQFATITATNLNGKFDITNSGEINAAGQMYTKKEALKIKKADLSGWDSVIIEIWLNNEEIKETILIK